MKKSGTSPPRFGIWLLKIIYDEDLLSEICGDLNELYADRAEANGRITANLYFFKDVLLSFRNLGLKRRIRPSRTNSLGLLKNYIKTAIRTLSKNPSSSFISIIGLSLAIGCAITTFLFADFMLNLDSFHEKKDRIYQIIRHVREEGVLQKYGSTSILLGKSLKQDHSSVSMASRMQYHPGNVRFGDKVFSEKVLFVDKDFSQIFDFPLDYGSKLSLNKKESVILSKESALKYFGDDNPMGKSLSIKFSEKVIQNFTVTGVLGKRPENSSFYFDIVVPFDNYISLQKPDNSWANVINATFILIKSGRGPVELADQMKVYQSHINSNEGNNPTEGFDFIPLSHLAQHSHDITDPVSFGNLPEGNYSFMFIGVLLLLMACFNYINVAVTSATKRLKEIGIRKVMGSARKDIMIQFLLENFVICFLSIMAGILFCYFLFIPGFNLFAPVEVPFQFSSVKFALYFYVGLFVFLGIVSGGYPAFYISRLQPVNILKGKLKYGSKNRFSYALLTIQFFLALMAIAGSFIFTDNTQYIKQLSWGYEPSGVLAIKTNTQKEFSALYDGAKLNSSVLHTGGSKNHVGVENHFINIDYLDKQFKSLYYDVSPGYLESMSIPTLKGSFFQENMREGNLHSIVVNQEFVDKMGWTQPLGEGILMDGVYKNVIGVVGEVRHSFFGKSPIQPMVFSSNKDEKYNYLVLKTKEEDLAFINELMKEIWFRVSPDDPYNNIYQSEIFNRYYNNVDENLSLIISISAMSVILACLGLYGLVGLKMQMRFKEFGIRKVLGANQFNIIKLANKEYLLMFVIAFGLGAPLGALYIQGVVERMWSISKPFSPWPILTALIIAFILIVSTIYHQIRKASQINPVEVLRDE